MLARTAIGILFVSLCNISLCEDAQNERKEMLLSELTVGPVQVKNVRLTQFLGTICSQQDVAYCIQDHSRKGNGSLAGVRISYSIPKHQDLQTVLHRLQQQHPVFSWRCEDGIIVITAKEVLGLEDNPLDAALGPFEFQGNLRTLLSYLSKKVPGLMPVILTTGQGIDAPTFNLEFALPSNVRRVLNTVTIACGTRWSALIRDKPLNVRITGGPGAPRKLGQAARVVLTFGRGTPPRLVKCAPKNKDIQTHHEENSLGPQEDFLNIE